MNGRRVVDSGPVILVGFCTHLLRGSAIPGVRISEDGALGLVRPGEDEPMPSGLGEAGVASLHGFKDWRPVEDGRRVTTPGRSMAVRNAV